MRRGTPSTRQFLSFRDKADSDDERQPLKDEFRANDPI